MGKINGNFEINQHEPHNLLIGDNEFETGLLKLAGGATAKDGYVVTRNADGNFEIASSVAAGTAFVLANIDDITNPSASAAATFPVRVCISGRVKRSLVSLGGTALTKAQADLLRASGIIAVDVTSIGNKDNE